MCEVLFVQEMEDDEDPNSTEYLCSQQVSRWNPTNRSWLLNTKSCAIISLRFERVAFILPYHNAMALFVIMINSTFHLSVASHIDLLGFVVHYCRPTLSLQSGQAFPLSDAGILRKLPCNLESLTISNTKSHSHLYVPKEFIKMIIPLVDYICCHWHRLTFGSLTLRCGKYAASLQTSTLPYTKHYHCNISRNSTRTSL